MIVRESLDFERGSDPIKSMDIGQTQLIPKDVDWDTDPLDNEFYEFISVAEFIPNWKGFPILVVQVKDKKTKEIGYYAVSNTGIGRTGFTVYGSQRALKNIKANLRYNASYKLESVNFERGLNPTSSMKIGRTVDIIGDVEDIRGVIIELVDDPLNKNKNLFWLKITEGKNKGEKIIVMKFADPELVDYEGKYWGVEWDLNLIESINFERGIDPKHYMDIGRNRKENDIRLVLACTEPRENRPKDDIKRIKYAIENFFNYDEIISIRIDYLKDINLFRNVTIFEAFIKGAPSNTNVINLIDHIYRYSTSDGKTFGECYQIEEKEEIDESINFERGLDPKSMMRIGRTVDIVRSNAEDSRGMVIGSVDDPVNKNNTLFWFKITEGKDKGQKIIVRKFDDPFGKYWGLEWDLKLGESINFERRLDPKISMGVGLTAIEKKIIEETDWSENLEEVSQVSDIVKVIRNYMGIPIVILKFHPIIKKDFTYVGISTVDRTEFVETAEIAEHDAKIDIENHYIREKDLKKFNLR